MSNNIIVLTTGLSGSSVITSFISQAGYWVGDETIIKDSRSGVYNTYENSRLVQLNVNLINTLSFEYNNDVEYKVNAQLFFEKAFYQYENKQIYSDFVEYCNSKGNWIWKDPRLWITIGFWQRILNKNNIKLIIVYRNPLSLWISLLNKRQIVGYFYLKNIERKSKEEIKQYINRNGLNYYLICYDELILYPEQIIPSLNEYLQTTLSVEDLKKVYNGKVGNKIWNLKNLVKAILIYIKNHHLRRK